MSEGKGYCPFEFGTGTPPLHCYKAECEWWVSWWRKIEDREPGIDPSVEKEEGCAMVGLFKIARKRAW